MNRPPTDPTARPAIAPKFISPKPGVFIVKILSQNQAKRNECKLQLRLQVAAWFNAPTHETLFRGHRPPRLSFIRPYLVAQRLSEHASACRENPTHCLPRSKVRRNGPCHHGSHSGKTLPRRCALGGASRSKLPQSIW